MTSDAPTELPAPPDGARAVHQTTQPGHGMVVILEQGFGRGSLYQLRAAVAAHAAQAGMPHSRTPDVVLAVSELVANVIRHGSGQGRLKMWANGHSLHCQVTDAGPRPTAAVNADPGTELPAGGPAPWPIESGHGLWVVSHLADQASFDAGPPSAAVISFTFTPAPRAGNGP